MARLLHCDVCNARMDDGNYELRVNHDGMCVRLNVHKTDPSHGFTSADVCQTCKRNMMMHILDRAGVRV